MLFGLGTSIWTTDLDKATAMAREIRTGMVWINDVNVAFPEAPWGGIKNSGVGFELSRHAFREYSWPQHISIETDVETISKPWWYPYS